MNFIYVNATYASIHMQMLQVWNTLPTVLDFSHKFLKTHEELRYEINILILTINKRISNNSDHELAAHRSVENYIYRLGFFNKLLKIYKELR